MPYCITCAARFKGGGIHCAIHNPYRSGNRHQDTQNYSSDSTNPSSIRYRADYRRRSRNLRFENTRDLYDHYNNTPNALVRYEHGVTTNVDAALAQPLAYAFTTLSHAHAISSVTYSVTPSGVQTLAAEANFEREQCTVCRQWFPDHEKLQNHQWEFPVGCEVHGLCMRAEDAQWHGTSERHERCFVRGCESVYRREGGWKGSVVEGHIRGWHC
ncbi:hypothetical protein BKA66DRAFT_437293 [Pyrenochaeta sp. MPI-SDFR-AT-0127]|nr:hypothetical protein BKA66DRAFT_437293 [Pyrenochaeta sp. MPI-SDFR-AT-0127]